MREILFRGKTKNNGWVEGLYLTYDPKYYDCLEKPSHVIVNNLEAIGCGLCIQADEMTGQNLDVYSDTVGQFTGLTDKNGRKIFEGDIVRLDIAGIIFNAVCKFHSGSFGLVWHYMGVDRWQAFTSICHVEYEVIGNVYDNPELMEGE